MAIDRASIVNALPSPREAKVPGVSGLIKKLDYSSFTPVKGLNPTATASIPYANAVAFRPNPYAYYAKSQSGDDSGDGLFDIPVLGQALQALDVSRAIVFSTIKETSDLFQGGEASVSDWYTQSFHEQVYGSDLLRNWGVDLPPAAMFAAGFVLDVAWDPLTYAAGIGLIARSAKVSDIALAAAAASKAAKASKGADAAEIVRSMDNVFDIVRTAGPVAASAAEPAAMRSLGMQPGIRFILPGTGRIGRTFIERPLGTILPPLKRAANRRRVKELATAPWRTDAGFDLTTAANQKLVTRRMRGKTTPSGIVGASPDAVRDAARKAKRLPISFGLPTQTLRTASAKTLSLMTSQVGRAVTRSSRSGLIAGRAATATEQGTKGWLGKLNSQAAVISARRGEDSFAALTAMKVERLGNQGALKSLRWTKETTSGLDNLVRQARKANVSGRMFDDLMFDAATTPDDLLLSDPFFSQWVVTSKDGTRTVDPLVDQAKAWWKKAGESAGIPPHEIEEFLYAARFRDDMPTGQGGRNKTVPLFGDDGVPLTGNPTQSRHLMEPKQIGVKLLEIRKNRVLKPTPKSKAYAADIDRIEQLARANLGSRMSVADEKVLTAEFEAVMYAELAEGVRYGDNTTNVMTNLHAGEVIKDVDEAGKNVLRQMQAIVDRVSPSTLSKGQAKKKAFTFSDDASMVLPRYINVMGSHIRSQTILDLAVRDGLMLPGTRFAQGELAENIVTLNAKLVRNAEQLDALRAQLDAGSGDPSEVANILADIAASDGITPEFAAKWLNSTDGQLAGTVADLQVQIDSFGQVLRAASDGTYYTGLSSDARALLDDVGWRDAVEGPFTQAQGKKIRDMAADGERRLAALADATEFFYQLQLTAGRLQMQRNQIGAVLNQWDVGAQATDDAVKRFRPSTIRTQLEEQALQLDELREEVAYVAQNIRGNLEAFDPTLVAGRGLAKLGDPALMQEAQVALKETMLGLWAAGEDFRRVASTFMDLPADGRVVRVDWKGGNLGWEVRWNSQPLAGLGDRRTLRTLLGEDRVETMGKVLATFDDSPAGRAQAALIETMENTRILQQRLGDLTPGVHLMEAVAESLDDADALAALLRAEYNSDLDVLVDSFLDQRLGFRAELDPKDYDPRPFMQHPNPRGVHSSVFRVWADHSNIGPVLKEFDAQVAGAAVKDTAESQTAAYIRATLAQNDPMAAEGVFHRGAVVSEIPAVGDEISMKPRAWGGDVDDVARFSEQTHSLAPGTKKVIYQIESGDRVQFMVMDDSRWRPDRGGGFREVVGGGKFRVTGVEPAWRDITFIKVKQLEGAVPQVRSRTPPKVRETMDQLSQNKAALGGEIETIVADIQKIAENVKEVGNRNTLIRGVLSNGPDSLMQQRKLLAAAAKKGDTAAALQIADDSDAAFRAVAKGQGNAAFVDNYMEGAEGVVRDILHNFGIESSYGRVGNLTKSKLHGKSFVAPVDSAMTPEKVAQLGRQFSEMFEAVARTADMQEMSNFLRGYARFQNWWKAQAVGTPGFVMRNMLGAAWMNNQLAGMPLSTMPRVVLIRDKARRLGQGDINAGLNVLIERGGFNLKAGVVAGGVRVPVDELVTFQQWYTSGIASGTGGRGIDITSALDNAGSLIEGKGLRSGARAGVWAPWRSDFKGFSAIRGWNTDVEFMARGSLAHHTMMGGESLDMAMNQVYKYHFDYTDLTEFERRAKQVIPFWTWQRRALPVLIESIGRNPKAWNRISNFKAEMEYLSPAEGTEPAYFGENMGIRLPFNWGGMRVYTLPSLPFADLASWSKGFEAGPNPGIQDRLLSMTRPIMESAIPHYKFPIEWMLDVRTFNQVPFSNDLKPAPRWAGIPALQQLLQLSGNLQEDANGRLLMTDKAAYMVEQFVPVFANASRLWPNPDPKWQTSADMKQIATALNFVLGLGFRVNTPKEQRNEMIRQMYKDSAEKRRQIALAGTYG